MRKYNCEYRKKLSENISTIDNTDALVDIFNIINLEIKDNFSSNSNGIFIDINKISDSTIDKLNEYINTLAESKEVNISNG